MRAPAPAATQPQTIEQIIDRLNGIIDDALRQGARIGYDVRFNIQVVAE